MQPQWSNLLYLSYSDVIAPCAQFRRVKGQKSIRAFLGCRPINTDLLSDYKVQIGRQTSLQSVAVAKQILRIDKVSDLHKY